MVKEISCWVDDIAQWPAVKSQCLHFYEMNDPSKLSRIENFVPYHDGLHKILMDSFVTETINSLMGVEAVLYKDRINFKPPGGGAHAAHQDGVAYESGSLADFDQDSIPYISILISVDKATRENGCFEVAADWPVSKRDILPMERPNPDHPNFSKIAQEVEDSIDWIRIETNPGDVIVFTERLPHRSAINTSTEGRRILYGVYNPLQEGDKREQYYEDKRKNINDSRYMIGNPHAPVR